MTMTIRTPLRTLTAASLLALALTSVPAGMVHAAPNSPGWTKNSCTAAGYAWSDKLGCAFRSCGHNGEILEPGEVRSVRGKDGKVTTSFCDGFTGRMVDVLRPGTSGPTTPPPTAQR